MSKTTTSDDNDLRRKKRTDRNRVRTIEHEFKLLDIYQDALQKGFSHEGWSDVASVYRQLSPFLTPEEYNALGLLWRQTWAQDVSVETVASLVDAVKARIESKPSTRR